MENHADSVRRALIAFLAMLLLPLAVWARPSAPVNTWEVKPPTVVLREGQGGEVKRMELKGLRHHLVLPDGDLIIVSDELDTNLLKGTPSAFLLRAIAGTGMMARLSGMDGKLRWVFPLQLGRQKSIGTYSNPVLFKDHVWIIHGLYLEKHDADTGQCLERFFPGKAILEIASRDGRIFLVVDNEFTVGKGKWERHHPRNVEMAFDGQAFDRPNFPVGLKHLYTFYQPSIYLSKSGAGSWQGGLSSYLAQGSLQRMYERAKVTVDWEEAESYFAGLVRLDPENPFPRFALGQIHLSQGRPSQATSEFEAAVRGQDGLGFWEYSRLGWMFENMHQPQWADRCYGLMQQRYFAMVPFRVPRSDIWTRVTLFPSSAAGANLHFAQGNIARAEHLYSLHKRMFPFCEGDATFSFLYARWLEENGEYEKAAVERAYYRLASQSWTAIEEWIALRFDLFFNGFIVSVLLTMLCMIVALVKAGKALFSNGRWGWVLVVVVLVGCSTLAGEIVDPGIRMIPYITDVCWGGILLFLLWTPMLSPRFRWFMGCAAAVCLCLTLVNGIVLLRCSWRWDPLWKYTYPGEAEARGELEMRHQNRPDDPYGSFLLGLSRQMQGLKSEALTLYKEAGDEPDALNNLGIILAEGGDAAGAKVNFEKAAALGNSAAYYNLYKISGDMGALGKARAQDPDLVGIQQEFLADRFMFAPLNSGKCFQRPINNFEVLHFMRQLRSL